MHPAILDMCRADSIFPCVLDAPLLFECGGGKLCTTVLAVTAPTEIRLERIMKRDSITKDEAELRMNAQKDEEFYRKNADFTVINDGRDITNQILNFMEEKL